MNRWGLALGGGGRNGAFAAGVVYALRTEFGLSFPIVEGISTGALAAPFVALDDLETLNRLYRNVNQENVMDKRNLLSAIYAGGLNSTEPLRKLIHDHVDIEALAREWPHTKVVVSAVNLKLGRIERCSNDPLQIGQMLEFIRASAAIPVLMDVVKIGDSVYGDGGLIDMVPLGPLAREVNGELDGIVAVLNAPLQTPALGENPEGMVSLLRRAIQIMLHEIQDKDVLVVQLATLVHHLWTALGENALHLDLPKDLMEYVGEFVPKSASGVPIPVRVIYPTRDLGDGYQFDPQIMTQLWQEGFDTARAQWPTGRHAWQLLNRRLKK